MSRSYAARRGVLAGRVGVGRDDDPIGAGAQSDLELGGRRVDQRGAQRRDAGQHPAGGPVDGDRVDGSFDEDGQAAALQGAGVLDQPVQVLALGVERRLAGVEVLRGAGVVGAVLARVAAADEPDDLTLAGGVAGKRWGT